MKYKIGFFVLGLFVSSTVLAGNLAPLPQFVAGTASSADAVNSNFNATQVEVNNNATDITANTAAIDTKQDAMSAGTGLALSGTTLSIASQTRYASVPPHAFHPAYNTYAYHYDGWSLQNDGGATNNRYYAPVYLPHGATISSLLIHFTDNSSNDLNVRLCKHTNGNSINCVFLGASSSGIETGWRTATDTCTGSSCEVNNITSDYYLDLHLPDTGATMRFAGARIEYQY